MSGLSHTPGKRAWGKTHRGFESRLLRQNQVQSVSPGCQAEKPRSIRAAGFFIAPLFWGCVYLLVCTIFMAVAIKADTSLILPGMIKVVVASAATLP